MRKKYQRKVRKSNHKFEVVQGQELLVQVPLPMAEVWAEMQTRVGSLPISFTAQTTSAPNFVSQSNSKNLRGCL